MYAARKNHHEGDQRTQLDDDTERGEEADCPPHVAEGGVLGAIAVAGEGNAGTFDGRAAAVEAVGVFAFAVLGFIVREVLLESGADGEEGRRVDGKVRTGL